MRSLQHTCAHKKSAKARLLLVLTLVLTVPVITAPLPVLAQSYDVCPSGCRFRSVQAAINATPAGRTIRIGPGTYYESLTLKAGVSLSGAAATTTILRGNGSRSVITAVAGNIRRDTVVEKVTISGGGGPFGGGIMIANGAGPTIRNAIVRDNTASNSGGGISVGQNGSVLLQGVSVLRNRAANVGGGIQIVNATGEIRNSYFEGNQTGAIGGAIGLLTAANPVVADNTIVRNRASDGGGVYVNQSQARIVRNTISENTASHFGGGVVFNTNSNGILRNNTIERNAAGVDAGGVVVQRGSSGLIERNRVRYNRAGSVGGGFTIFDRAAPTLLSNEVRGNTAIDGAGIQIELNSAPLLENNVFAANLASRFGGGVVINVRSNPTLRTNQFLSNRAENSGGGLYVNSGSQVRLERNTISRNWSRNVGAGLVLNSDNASPVTNNYIDHNQTNGHGAGVYLTNSNARITTNQIVDNSAGQIGGGVVALSSGAAQIVNNLVARNHSGHVGDGIYVAGPGPLINSNTIANNDPGLGGSGIHLSNNGTPAITDNLIGDNDYGIRSDGGRPRVLRGNSFYRNRVANYYGLPPGEGNVLSDPKLTRGPGGDYYLSQRAAGQPEDSPLIDSGVLSSEPIEPSLAITASQVTSDVTPVQSGTMVTGTQIISGSVLPEAMAPSTMITDTPFVEELLPLDILTTTHILTATELAPDLSLRELIDMDTVTTRTDGAPDQGPPDIGFHYPRLLPFGSYLPAIE